MVTHSVGQKPINVLCNMQKYFVVRVNVHLLRTLSHNYHFLSRHYVDWRKPTNSSYRAIHEKDLMNWADDTPRYLMRTMPRPDLGRAAASTAWACSAAAVVGFVALSNFCAKSRPYFFLW
jgi:hypothetical protein